MNENKKRRFFASSLSSLLVFFLHWKLYLMQGLDEALVCDMMTKMALRQSALMLYECDENLQDCLYLHFISELIKKIEHNEIVQHKASF
jgi:hypothetical protein